MHNVKGLRISAAEDVAQSGGRPTRYRLAHRLHVVRQEGRRLDVATPAGWRRCSRGLAWLLRRGRSKRLTAAQAERRLTRAGCKIPLEDPPLSDRSLAAWFRTRGVVWALSPPLGSGASRFFGQGTANAVAASDARSLGKHTDDGLASQAQAGYERARERLRSIEAKAATLLQATGLTGTLVLANGALLVGDGGLDGAEKVIVTIGLLVASAALVVAGVALSTIALVVEALG